MADLMYARQDRETIIDITGAKLKLSRPSHATKEEGLSHYGSDARRLSGHRADRVDAADDTRSELLTSYRS